MYAAPDFEVHYDPEAKAVDFPASSVAGEFRRRVRISTGSFRALPALLRIPKTGFTAFAFFSHKLLRWILPVLFILAFVSNLFLLSQPFYAATPAGAVVDSALGGDRLCLSGIAQPGTVHPGRLLSGRHASGVSGRNAAQFFGRKEAAWQRTN